MNNTWTFIIYNELTKKNITTEELTNTIHSMKYEDYMEIFVLQYDGVLKYYVNRESDFNRLKNIFKLGGK